MGLLRLAENLDLGDLLILRKAQIKLMSKNIFKYSLGITQ